MTQEEKAKRYDEAIERAKNLYNCDKTSADVEIACENIFPELKESEDERIRKELIDFVKSRLAGFPECGRFIAWLEKQSKYSILNVPSREVILAIWDLGNEWKELTNGCISTEYSTQLDYIQKHWEESEYYLREKKVEPKFKIGDWVVDNYNCVWKIEGILNQFYILECPEGGESRPTIDWVDKTFHLWTIQDAKDGDVLAFNDDTIVIFKNLYNSSTFHSYCHIDDDIFDISKDDMPDWWKGNGFHPATQEQRDILFTKMKEAGYKWDGKKKELKKEGIK